MIISIEGLDHAAVLAVLYNNSKPLGMGFMHFIDEDMSVEGARKEILDRGACFRERDLDPPETPYFDYLHGRVMKIQLQDPLDPGLYDRDNGEGAAARAIDTLRKP